MMIQEILQVSEIYILNGTKHNHSITMSTDELYHEIYEINRHFKNTLIHILQDVREMAENSIAVIDTQFA